MSRRSVRQFGRITAFLCLLFLAVLAKAEPVLTLETADGNYGAGLRREEQSGNTWLSGFTQDGDAVDLSFAIRDEGFYDITVQSRSMGGHKENYVAVDGVNAGVFVSEDGDFAPSTLKRYWLSAGTHTLSLIKYWGWVQVDTVALSVSEPLPDNLYDVSSVPANPNASENARRLMAYLADQYGRKIISGQFCEGGAFGKENAAIWRTTGGRYPAILGMDLLDYTPSRTANGTKGSTVEKALEYWDRGGIVAFCWHWTAPEAYITGNWYSAFYTDQTSIDLARIMNGEDQAGYDLLLRDIDAIAQALQPLRDADVPVLWRPLHEAGGGWFWWGAAGPEAYLSLYRLLYEKLTVEYGMNNLLWIWNGQDPAWYPGDDYVDLIGLDLYPGEHVYTSQSDAFLQALACTEARKMIILSENGCMPDPDLVFRDGTVWGSFCTWEGEFILAHSGFNKLSERYTEAWMVQKIYSDDRVVTREDLPDLKSYPLPELD